METVTNLDTLFTYEVRGDVILASWKDELSAESQAFLDSVKHLIRFGHERSIKKILIDSGTPAGGVLTEEVMLLMQNSFGEVAIEKMALLESSDFHWDNNLYQFLQYLKVMLQLSYQVRLFNNKTAALEWLGAI